VATRTELSEVDHEARLLMDDAAAPDAYDIALATRALRVHCVTPTPGGEVCLNCGWPHPCVTQRWGRKILLAAGWSEREIAALDRRSGAWS